MGHHLSIFHEEHAPIPSHHLPDFLNHLGGIFRRGEGGNGEGARGPPEVEAAADAIGETQVRADAGHESGRKASLPQDVVHQAQGKKIGVMPGETQVTQADLALGEFRPVQQVEAGRGQV